MALNVASLFDYPTYVFDLISCVARVPCNSSIVIFLKPLGYSVADNLASYLKGSDISTFCMMKDYLNSSPNPLMALTTLSTLSK